MHDPFKQPSGPEYEKMLKEYYIERQYFKEMINLGIALSDKSGGINTSNRYIISTQVFTRIVLSSITLDRILPNKNKNIWGFWDISSLFCLTRAFIESIYMFIYIGVDNCDKEECAFRVKLLKYRNNMQKYRIFKEIRDNDSNKEFKEKLEDARKIIQSNRIFSELDSKIQKRIIKGYQTITKNRDELSQLIPSDVINKQNKLLYQLFSNHIHTAPFSFLSQDNNRGRGLPNNIEVFYFSYILGIVNIYYAFTNVKHAEIFRDFLWASNSERLKKAKKLITRKEYGEPIS